jgi:WD40 repeat protein
LALAVSPNGRFLASRGRDNIVRLWDRSRQESREYRLDEIGIYQISFSPKSTKLAVSAPKALHIWDLESGQQSALPYAQGSVYSAAFSPNGQLFASAGLDRSIVLWNIATGQTTLLRGHGGTVRCLAFDPEGRYIASGSEDRTVRLWDLSAGALRILRGHRNVVTSIAFSPDGRELASGGTDSEIRLWTVESAATAPSTLQAFPDWFTSLTSVKQTLESEPP